MTTMEGVRGPNIVIAESRIDGKTVLHRRKRSRGVGEIAVGRRPVEFDLTLIYY